MKKYIIITSLISITTFVVMFGINQSVQSKEHVDTSSEKEYHTYDGVYELDQIIPTESIVLYGNTCYLVYLDGSKVKLEALQNPNNGTIKIKDQIGNVRIFHAYKFNGEWSLKIKIKGKWHKGYKWYEPLEWYPEK